MNKQLLIYSFKILPFNILFRKFKRKICNKFKINNGLINYDFNKFNESNFDINFGLKDRHPKIYNFFKEYYLENLSELKNPEILSKNQNIINNFMDNKITIFNSIYDLNELTNTTTKNLNFYSVYNFDFINKHKWESTENHKIKGDLGYDIKVPWEIGRLQFLSYIVTIITIDKESNVLKEVDDDNSDKNSDDNSDKNHDFNKIADKIIEFIVGFIDYNPIPNPIPNSTQWLSAMDVSIRLSNIIYILDSLSHSGYNIEPTKIDKVKKSIFEHIKFVFLHLEWSDGMRANHYYSNITGLFYAINYLTPKNDLKSQELFSFKKFLIAQIINETNFQFNEDGSNFEDSIPYHTLSFELLLFNLIFLNSLNSDEISLINNSKIISNKIDNKDFQLNNVVLQLLYKRLKSICEFTKSVNNNGLIPQIGDNDSGTFINFDILNFNKSSLNYNSLDIKHRLRIFEKSLNVFEQKIGYDHKLSNKNTKLVNDDIIQNYEDFGIVINKNKELYFTLKYSQLGQLGKGGHSHNDSLSFVLSLYGEEIFTDAGTYSYTKNYKLRNKFRSSQNHNVLTINDLEQNQLFDRNLDDMFWIYSDIYSNKLKKSNKSNKSKLISFNQNIVIAEHKNKKYNYKRAFLFNDKNINCKEEINIEGNKKVNFLLAPNIKITEVKENYLVFEKLLNNNKEKIVIKLGIDKNEILISSKNNTSDNLSIDDYEYSPNYLSKISAKKIIISSNKNIINWELSWKLVQL